MVSPKPAPANPRSGGYFSEVGTFTDMSSLFRFFQPRIMKVSKNSPPVLNVDVREGERCWDRTLNREYTVSNGVLRFVQFT